MYKLSGHFFFHIFCSAEMGRGNFSWCLNRNFQTSFSLNSATRTFNSALQCLPVSVCRSKSVTQSNLKCRGNQREDAQTIIKQRNNLKTLDKRRNYYTLLSYYCEQACTSFSSEMTVEK